MLVLVQPEYPKPAVLMPDPRQKQRGNCRLRRMLHGGLNNAEEAPGMVVLGDSPPVMTLPHRSRTSDDQPYAPSKSSNQRDRAGRVQERQMWLYAAVEQQRQRCVAGDHRRAASG